MGSDDRLPIRCLHFEKKIRTNRTELISLFLVLGMDFSLHRIVWSAILTRGQVTKHPWRNSLPLKPSRMLHNKRLKSMVVWDTSNELPVERYLRDTRSPKFMKEQAKCKGWSHQEVSWD